MSAPRTARIEKELVVLNKLGLHARPAAEFVRTVRTFRSTIHLQVNDARCDGGRLMELLMANLDQGAKFTLIVEGPDAEKAVARIESLLVEFRDAEDRGDYS